MKELLVRALSGAVYVALVLGTAWLGPWAAAALFLPITVLAAQEWHRLRWSRTHGPLVAVSLSVAALAYTLFALGAFVTVPQTPYRMVALVLIVVLVLIVLLFRSAVLHVPSGRSDGKLQDLLAVAFGIALPFACATWLVAADPMLFIGFMLLLWTNDTGAYLVGKAMGRNKLMPKVSPGKTWEGLLGGIGLTLVVAWLWAGQCAAFTTTGWLLAAVLVSLTATAGDLFESALKRAAGVKDSGRIMPGHGGVLDRFDGYLLAAPTLLALFFLLG